MQPKARAIILRYLLVLLLCYGVFTALIAVNQRSLLYFPASDRPDLSSAPEEGVAAVEIMTADGLPLLAWYWPARPGRPTLLHLHGNAGHIGHRAPKLAGFLRDGMGLLLLEYRGFGGNPGSPTEEGLLLDGEAGFAWLIRSGVAPGQIVLYGESLGTGIAVHLAGQEPAGAVILEAPYTAIADIARAQYWYLPVDWLLMDRFESARRILDVTAPILIVHGTQDAVIPVEHGERLADLSGADLVLFDGAGHNDLFGFGADAVIQAWIAEVLRR